MSLGKFFSYDRLMWGSTKAWRPALATFISSGGSSKGSMWLAHISAVTNMPTPARYGPVAKEVLDSLVARNWKWNGSLRRCYKFTSHSAACEFTVKTAKLADKIQHHPEIHIRYNTITYELRTNDLNGAVTKIDGQFADAIERMYSAPKQSRVEA